jgi:hypothetical protein
MTGLQAVITVVVAIIGLTGTSIGSILAYKQFMLKRKDEKEEKDIQKRIDEAVEKAKKEMMEELNKGLYKRGEEGRERFEINSKAIEENTAQISELTSLMKEQAVKINQFTESFSSLNTVVKTTAESQRNSNYDRLLIVTNKILKSGKMTISDKTNLKQLYKSWKDLNGVDPKMDTYYEECMQVVVSMDEKGE